MIRLLLSFGCFQFRVMTTPMRTCGSRLHAPCCALYACRNLSVASPLLPLHIFHRGSRLASQTPPPLPSPLARFAGQGAECSRCDLGRRELGGSPLFDSVRLRTCGARENTNMKGAWGLKRLEPGSFFSPYTAAFLRSCVPHVVPPDRIIEGEVLHNPYSRA